MCIKIKITNVALISHDTNDSCPYIQKNILKDSKVLCHQSFRKTRKMPGKCKSVTNPIVDHLDYSSNDEEAMV